MTDHVDRLPTVAVVIVAAGRGERYGAACKVLEVAGGRTLLDWSLDAAIATPGVQDVIVVAGAHSEPEIRKVVDARIVSVPLRIVLGGARRQDSVIAGVEAIPGEPDVVLVHDGARPLAGAGIFAACALAAHEVGAAIVACPVSDTLKRVDGHQISGTVSRDGLWAAQTPQGFRRSLLLSGLDLATDRDVEYTDEASMLEALGHTVAVVPGSRQNIKVTVPEDLEIVDALLRLRRAS